MKPSSRHWDMYYPYIFALVVGGIAYALAVTISAGDRTDFLSASISFGAVIAGFVATSKAILMALPSDGVLARIKKSGYINDLADYLKAALYGAITFCAVNVAGFFLTSDLPKEYMAAWFLLGTFASLAFTRLTSLMLLILRMA